MSKYRSHAEKVLAGYIKRRAIPLSYVGKGQYWIRLSNGSSANPDFINEKRRKIVEVFGGMGTIHSEEEGLQRISLLKEKGWDCLIVTDHELYTNPESVVGRIFNFTGPLILPVSP